MSWYHYAIFFVVLAALLSSVFYSFRYRLHKDPQIRGIYAARMNISMGITLLGIAGGQLLLFEMSRLRLAVAVLFTLIGLFNLFAGLRNLSFFGRK